MKGFIITIAVFMICGGFFLWAKYFLEDKETMTIGTPAMPFTFFIDRTADFISMLAFVAIVICFMDIFLIIRAIVDWTKGGSLF